LLSTQSKKGGLQEKNIKRRISNGPAEKSDERGGLPKKSSKKKIGVGQVTRATGPFLSERDSKEKEGRDRNPEGNSTVNLENTGSSSDASTGGKGGVD